MLESATMQRILHDRTDELNRLRGVIRHLEEKQSGLIALLAENGIVACQTIEPDGSVTITSYRPPAVPAEASNDQPAPYYPDPASPYAKSDVPDPAPAADESAATS